MSQSIRVLIGDDSLELGISWATAFKEAGFRTAFFSNQRYNHSFIDFFGMEADTYDFIKEDNTFKVLVHRLERLKPHD